jgi:hypothetical protein
MVSRLVLASIAMLVIVGCTTTPTKKSHNYDVRYIPSNEIDNMSGVFVLLKKGREGWTIQKYTSAFAEIEKDYDLVYEQGILWVSNDRTIVTPYFKKAEGNHIINSIISFNAKEKGYTPHGTYDPEKKTFACRYMESSNLPSRYPQPHPCWSPYMTYKNPLHHLTDSPLKLKILDTEEIVGAVEKSALFERIKN